MERSGSEATSFVRGALQCCERDAVI